MSGRRQPKRRQGGSGASGRTNSGKGRRATSGAVGGSPRARQAGAPANAGSSGSSGAGGPRRKRSRKGLGGDQVEGRQAVRELLLADKRRVKEVLLVDDVAESEILVDIRDLANELSVPLRVMTRRRLSAEAATESHQGVVARAEPLAEADFDRLLDDPAAFLLVLDGITDPGNLGAMLRTAECAGVTGVVLGRHRSAHVSPTVTKTAAGAVEHVPMAMAPGIPAAILELNKREILTVGLDGGASHSIFDLPGPIDGPIALVLGAEGAGLSRLVRERVATTASIPMAGRLNSLNVAMATAVACFEIVRSRTDRSMRQSDGRTRS